MKNFLNKYICSERLFEYCDVVLESGIRRNGRWFHRRDGGENLNIKNCIIYCKLDHINDLFAAVEKSPYKHILITGNSDQLIDKALYSKKPKNIVWWFGVNVNVWDFYLIPFPIGLERFYGGGNSWDATIIDEQLKKEKNIKNLVYFNCTLNNNPERNEMYNHFKDSPFVTHSQRVPFDQYVEDIYSHSFCLSPAGASGCLDCHRTWESIYLGTIPIVKRSMVSEYFSDLPILIYDDLSELTEEYLLEKLEEYKARDFSYNKADLRWWKKLFTTLRGELDEQTKLQ